MNIKVRKALRNPEERRSIVKAALDAGSGKTPANAIVSGEQVRFSTSPATIKFTVGKN